MNKKDYENLEFMQNMQALFIRMMQNKNSNLPHIKEYRKMRKLHSEIIQKMYDYYDTSEELKKEMHLKMEEYLSHPQCKVNGFGLDLDDKLERNLFVDFLIYADYQGNNLCKEFLNRKKFRAEQIINFVKAMDVSKLGIYEIISSNQETAQGQLRNVLTNEVITLTDESMFIFPLNEVYQVLRVIKVDDICFQTGLILGFKKDHLRKWVKNHKNKQIKPYELINLYEMSKQEKYRANIME